MDQKPIKPLNVPFCRQQWKIPALILTVVCLALFAWGIHLMRDHYDELDGFGMSDNSSWPGTTTAEPQVNAAQVRAQLNLGPVDSVVRPSVVNIAGMKAGPGGSDRFVSAGSGVIVNSDGHVATAYHIIEGMREIMIRVQTPNGPRQYPAKIVKAVPRHDIAVLKIASRDLFPYLIPGNSKTLRDGSAVTAWGDPDGTQVLYRRGTVSMGQGLAQINVGKAQLTHLIPTGTVYHWAQSGGPLVDGKGRLMGINVAVQGPNGLLQGYAVPVHVLVTHFSDVVKFPPGVIAALKGAGNGWNGGGGLQEPGGLGIALGQGVVAGTGQAGTALTVAAQMAVGDGVRGPPGDPGVTSARTRRTADDWWDRARSLLGLDLTKRPHAAQAATSGAGTGEHGPALRVFGYPISTFIGLLLLGFVSGVSGGMMTMGGGIIKVTGLISVFGYGLLLVRPVAYLTNIFMYGAASLRYRRDELFRWEAIRPLVPWAMAGVVIGYFVGNILRSNVIHYLLGVFAFLLGIKMLVELAESSGRKGGVFGWLRPYLGSRPERADGGVAGNHPLMQAGILGLPMGIISGILGITGGVVEVPLQRYVAGVPLRNAIANSAVLVFFASIVGSLVAMLHGVQSGAFVWEQPVVMALILVPGAWFGGLVGAWLTTVVRLDVLRWFYAVLMFAIAGRMVVA
ncbi:MAG: TSUP family transporter [Magnetococcales bacterium]|nr:TSUP family transporter [Magnetococcales bacterium]